MDWCWGVQGQSGRIGVVGRVVYVKRQEFALRYKKEPYFLNIADRTPTVYNREIID